MSYISAKARADRNERILKMSRAGYARADIARTIGCSTSTVTSAERTAGFARKRCSPKHVHKHGPHRVEGFHDSSKHPFVGTELNATTRAEAWRLYQRGTSPTRIAALMHMKYADVLTAIGPQPMTTVPPQVLTL